MGSSTDARQYSIGVDFGTNTVRALVVRCEDGAEVGTYVFAYPHGRDGVVEDERDPNLARQHPADYVFGLEETLKAAVQEAEANDQEFSASKVVGIGVDATGSTPLPVDADGEALALKSEFRENPAAMAWLWKDHTSYAEADEITAKIAETKRPYLDKIGGTYSSEWFWAKILKCKREAPDVFDAAYSWVELHDYVPALLTGNLKPDRMKRGICAAGHKAMYSPDWDGLPDEEFLGALDPDLAELRGRLYDEAVAADQIAGELTEEWAQKTGLPAGIPVAVGALDAHMGGVGSGIRPGRLVKILGTSAVDLMVGDEKTPEIPGVSGVVQNSILPGQVGVEAGQAAVGDLFNWYVRYQCPAEYADGNRHENLNQAAAELKPGESGLLALDWNNGNRCVLVDPLLTGMLVGQTLHTTGPEVYRALIEATAFGARTIIERIAKFDVPIDEIVTGGGIAEKSPLTMQIYADICNRPIKLATSGQASALGSAIFGAVVGGAHPSVAKAVDAMTSVRELVYEPNPDAVYVYDELYTLYRQLHDAFGRGVKGDCELANVMKNLIAVRDRARN
jgi:L-ribulokinase